jgi:nucleoside-diphosphate-sugar epimerase
MSTSTDRALPDPRNLRDARVMVTGAAGFLGTALRRRLDAAGAQVLGTDLRMPRSVGSNEDLRILDLADRPSLEAAAKDFSPDAVIHLAGLLGGERSWAFLERALEVNLLGTVGLLRTLADLPKVPQIALAGSSEEFGNAPRSPIDETCPDAPVSPYSYSKSFATRTALQAHSLWGVPVRILRPFILYGPGQTGPMFVPSLLEALAAGSPFPMSGGRQVRDFVFVDDAADAFARSVAVPESAGRILNLCTGRGHTLLDVVEIARTLPGARPDVRVGEVPYRPNEAWDLVGDPTLSRQLLGWEAAVPLEEGLRRTWSHLTKGVQP